VHGAPVGPRHGALCAAAGVAGDNSRIANANRITKKILITNIALVIFGLFMAFSFILTAHLRGKRNQPERDPVPFG
jgi:uncharacterized membrane protein